MYGGLFVSLFNDKMYSIICNFCNILQHLFHSNIVEALANTTLLAI